MAGARVTWDEDFDTFEVEGCGTFGWMGENTLGASVEIIGRASIKSLQEAWERANRRRGADGSLLTVSDDPPEKFNIYSDTDDVQFWVSSNDFLVLVAERTPALIEDAGIRTLLKPWLERHRARLRRVATDRAQFGEPRVYLEVEVPARLNVRAALARGKQVQAMVQACCRGAGDLDPAGARELIEGAHDELLLGQPERDWLEAKGSPYQLGNEYAKFELAKDVAALANLPDGGLLIVGFATVTIAASEYIDEVRPFPTEMMDVQQVRDVIRNGTYPAVQNLDVALHARGKSRALGTIHIPRQPPELHPILVRGAAIDGRVRRQFATLPTRLGASTAYADVANIHALLVAGRAALRSRES